MARTKTVTKSDAVIEAEANLRRVRAQEKLEVLENGVESFKQDIGSVNSLEELYKKCASLVSKVNNARQALKEKED